MRMLLIGGLGHMDLSGKVPRPGLLMLRQALRKAGHEGVVENYAAPLTPRLFPPALVGELRAIYQRSLKPLVIEGASPWQQLKMFFRLRRDMTALPRLTEELAAVEKNAYEEIGQELARRVQAEKFDAVGFSLYLGSSTSGSIAIANRLRRENPNLPIIFGGPQTTHFAETIYRETTAPTALVIGEGELSLVELAGIIDQLKTGELTQLHNIPNLVFRTAEGQVIATPRKRLPLNQWIELSRAPYEEQDFLGVMKYAFIEASRGCFYQCHFCSQPLLSGTQRYVKPAKEIVDEMEALYQRFGIVSFELVGSSTPPHQAKEIADEIIGRNLAGKFHWVLFMRGKDERQNSAPLSIIMKRMKLAGAAAVFFGVEAADDATLNRMGKKAGLDDIKAAMLAAKNAGMATIGSFIYPYPGMPENEGDLILRFLQEVQPLSAPVQALGLYPGTYDANHAADLGCEIVYPDKKDQALFLAGRKSAPTMQSPEVLQYLLKYPLILSLPMRFWPPLPYKIDGKNYAEYVKAVNNLQRRITKLGIISGFSHSHYLLSQVLGLSPHEFAERLFYCSLTGDPAETERIIAQFNSRI
ncbi:MAG: radical SAM protein [Candidatus Margulisbacteria bacterium]|nr:radical SAM protein [Candidatus Margulisiibacteriota bacterium]